jgi:hypothetical protein
MAGSGARAAHSLRHGSDWLAPSRWLARWPYVAVILVFGALRLIYRFALDLRFDYSPVYEFIQYIDPWFVEHDFVRSILYLNQQPPLQNLLTGGCIRVFGTPAAFTVLEVLYVALGLATILSMLHAMLRLGVTRTTAAVFAALYAVSPVTVFYEYWLLYHTPVVALLTLSVVS